ncbi:MULTISPECIES: ATP-binding cassette domain-containing protein [unclassified Leptolyngbya]|uniref:ATP-binding cassette domain-containing protein n=1 Tax=unclassified Leptolyngbya TaxID=2650499 RepID=UPI0016862BE7|nr:ATP-binding cassette domain-containing protein [Leptolyngbya sp. FACHB-8]MBD2154005.1 ATP-binding cassette domain-containing protein [Leptolyngbya sp. FACHB-16]
MAQVVLENIYKSFPPRKGRSSSSTEEGADSQAVSVLRRINLTVYDGEFMVLVGPSGCGKSTLLRLIAGLETVTGGNIWVGDRRVNDLPPKQRDIAMVFQSYALYPHMSVYENLAFGLRRSQAPGNVGNDSAWERALVAATRPLPKGLRYWSEPERQVEQRVRTVAQMLQIDTLLDRLPKQLSGGQKQRVALGRAMARNPQVFLMDEPLSNLDAKLRTETRAQIVNLQRKLGTTTIYVTHDQTEAMTMGDRIAVLNAGQIQQIATPLELYNHPANEFVAAFIGSPPMNFLEVQVQAPLLIADGQFRLTLPEFWEPALRPYQGRSLRLGIRPEHFSISAPAPKNLPVRVERVEALGSETYLTVRRTDVADEPLLQIRVEPDRRVSLREDLWLALAPDKLHLFDRETGLAIAPS